VEKRERYFKWSEAVYVPFRMKNPGLMEYSRYEILKKNPDYPENIAIQHYLNQNAYDFRVNSQQDTDVTRDMRTGWGTEWIWGSILRLMKSARRDTAIVGRSRTTQIINAPLMHIETLNIEIAEYDRYAAWFTTTGCEVFIPLLLETTKLMGWDLYEWTRNPLDEYKVKTYPKYISFLYFQGIEDFNDFERSPALKALKTMLKQILPGGITYKWYVEYLLWYVNRKEA